MAWYDSDADTTYKLFGGMLMIGGITFGCFLTDQMTPELIHAIVGFAAGWVTSRSGTQSNGTKDKNERTFKP